MLIIILSWALFYKAERLGYDALTPTEKIIFIMVGLEREINNGGFEQWFFNSAGNYALDTPAALEAIGANHTAGIVT